MPLDLEKRHTLTIGSSHDLSVPASAWAGLWANCSSSASNRGCILAACLARMFLALLPVPSPVPYALVRAAASGTALDSSSSQTSRTECSQCSLVARMTGQGVGAAGVPTRCARGRSAGPTAYNPAPRAPAGEGGESREAKPLWEVASFANSRDSRQSGKSIDWQKNGIISAQSLFSRSCLKVTKKSHIL